MVDILLFSRDWADVGMSDTWKRFRRDRLAMAGLVIVFIFAVAAVAAPVLAPYDPTEQFFDGLTLEGAPLPPNARFWFGTDTNGRDQFSRLLYGAQTSLLIGIVANGLAVAVGTALGLIAGYARGFTGSAIMRFTDLMMAFPPLLLAIALAAILKPGLNIVILVIALVNWVQIARVIYTETIALSEREYIEAARALGAGSSRILLRHMLPHLIPTIIVYATLGIATTVLLEAIAEWKGVFDDVTKDAAWVPVFNEKCFTYHSERLGGDPSLFTNPIHIPVNYDYIFAKDAQ